jgi:hypothetical protein
MLKKNPMKYLYLLSLIIFGFTANGAKFSPQGPVANAGPDQTIYLTQTSTVTLNGSGSSGDSFQWTEVSTDYKSGASINSPNSAVTSVTGLPQGVFYFQLAVTSGGVTVKDVVVVKVDYDVPPNGKLLRNIPIADPGFIKVANIRDDTTTYFGYDEPSPYSHIRFTDTRYTGTYIYFERSRTPGIAVDAQAAKLYTTVEDGYQWDYSGYARSQLSWGNSSYVTLDTNITYVIELKFYFPQPVAENMATIGYPDWGRFAVFGVHGDDHVSGNVSIQVARDSVCFYDGYYSDARRFIKLLPTADWYNKTHTFRLTIREGASYPGQDAFVKVEVDGVQKYYRNFGQIGNTLQRDYLKLTGVYDYNNLLVNPNNHTRNKKFSLVTEAFNLYQLDNNKAPVANAGTDQTIVLPTNSASLSGSGKDYDGTISSYQWTKISGPSGGTIKDANSPNTDVTDLIAGVYQFELKVTDNQGATGKSTTQITVNSPANSYPTANSGTDQTITLPTNSVTLSGTGKDNDGTISSYQWTKISGPSSGSIDNSNSANTTVSNLEEGVYQFELKVTDNDGAAGEDTVQVNVNAASNVAPTANAGTDQTITLPINSVNLSGAGTDSDGSISKYFWTKISGPSTFKIADSSSATTSVSGLIQGSYQFELKVTDNDGSVGKDTVEINVNAASNVAPTANAGADQTITLPTNSVNLSGAGTDSDGSISKYFWTKISGPSTFKIADSSSATTSVSGLIQGSYQFELKVTDNDGSVGKDTVEINVNAASNVAPTANAGADQTITLPTNSVNLSGTGTDSDGSISKYSWTKISGPSTLTVKKPNSAVVTVTNLIAGVYKFELKVTDNKGDVGKDTVQVKVNAANNVDTIQKNQNLAPTANAGADQTITLPTNNVNLSGSGADSDGSISKYSWTKISGPSAFKISDSSLANTDVSELVEGIYEFELKVTDDKGDVGMDTVEIKVNAVIGGNIAPTANAGPDKTITLPTDSLNLLGSGADSDGTISAYSWTKISGPSTFSIKNSSSSVVEISNLIEGKYQFELKVTDNKGSVGKDTVMVIVNSISVLPTIDSTNTNNTISDTSNTDSTSSNAPNDPPITENVSPLANAGNDLTVVSTTQFVDLNGTGTDDGKIVSYSWTQISGPSTATILSSDSANTQITNLNEGTYVFELKVTDNDGAVGKDTMKVTVVLEKTSPVRLTSKSSNLTVYPNPVHDIANVEVNTDQNNINVMIVITDMTGKAVYTKEFVSTSNYIRQQIDMSNLIKGVYIVSLYFDGMQQQSVKVVRL